MGDVPPPLFLGGLPPRGSTATTKTPIEVQVTPTESVNQVAEPAWSKAKKRGTLALIVSCVGAIVVLGTLAASPSLVAALTPPQNNTKTSTQASAETTAAKAAIAGGGGAVQGHIVSPELCTALHGFVAVSAGAVSSTKVTPEMLTAMEGLAAVKSPNQGAYQGFVNLVKDPASVTSIADAQALSADFAKATQADTVTCL